MFIVKVSLAVVCLAAAANALVTVPDEGLRPPKRPPPPPPPTLAPFPYAAAEHSAIPIVPVSRVLPVVPAIPVAPIFRIAPVAPLHTVVPSHRDAFNSPLSQPEGPAPVFRDEVKDKNGQFDLRHSDGKGTVVKESGRLISTDDGWEYVIVKEGDYSFKSPEGSPVLVKYVADEKGVKTSYSIRAQ